MQASLFVFVLEANFNMASITLSLLVMISVLSEG
jgi:hypothetical protein